MTDSQSHIVVGVEFDENSIVLRQAVIFAHHFDALVVCVISNPGRYAATEAPDGTVTSLDFDPDDPEEHVEAFDEKLHAQIEAIFSSEGVTWSERAMAGDPALQLARVADEVDAAMIIVGARRQGYWGATREFLNGSVAAHLAHRQHRPVVVVPLSPVRNGEKLPWLDTV